MIPSLNFVKDFEKLSLKEQRISEIDDNFQKAFYPNFQYILTKEGIYSNRRKIKLSNEECEELLSFLNSVHNCFIKAYIYNLILENYIEYKNSLKKEIIDEYIKCIDVFLMNSKEVVKTNIMKILEWSFYFSPQERKIIKEKFLQAPKEKQLLLLIDEIISDKNIKNFFSSSEYFEILSFFIDNIEPNCLCQIFNNFLDFFDENSDKKLRKESHKLYCDFILKNISYFTFHPKIENHLKKCYTYMNSLKIYSNTDFLKITDKIYFLKNELLNSSRTFSFSLSIPTNELKEWVDKNFKKQKNDEERIDFICFYFPFLSLEQNKSNYEKNKKELFFVNEIFNDKFTNLTIDLSQKSDEEKMFYHIEKEIKSWCDICFLLFDAFFKNFQNDEVSKKYIHSIFSNNKLISKEMISYMVNAFSSFFLKQDFFSFFYIILSLETNLRYFFSNKKISINQQKNIKNVVGLGDFFNHQENNIYKEKLLEIIDDDFYFSLNYMFAPGGFEIRNFLAHKSLFLDKGILNYAVFLIFRLYWSFQK